MNDIKPAATENILGRLKRETAAHHRQTEDQVDLMRPDFSLEDYRKLLIKFYRFYLPFEKQMQAALNRQQIDFDYPGRLNTPRLFADLQHLGMTPEDIGKVAPAENLSALDSPEKVFGALYVVEGSTLGGQVIARHLKEKFGLEAGSGSAFFSGYGSETGKMWNAFRAAILDFAETSRRHSEIVGAADETFEKIGNILSET